MKDIKKFKIQLEKPWAWEGLVPPQDVLGELPDFERGLRRLCFECNHRVLIEIGDEKFDVFLDPDIILILDNLPQQILELSRGKRIQIEFPESYREITFMPDDDEIRCTSSQFGQVVRHEHFLLERTQVLEVLGGFLDEIVCLALDGGYINPEQGHQFLAKIQINGPLCEFTRKGLPKHVNHSKHCL